MQVKNFYFLLPFFFCLINDSTKIARVSRQASLYHVYFSVFRIDFDVVDPHDIACISRETLCQTVSMYDCIIRAQISTER